MVHHPADGQAPRPPKETSTLLGRLFRGQPQPPTPEPRRTDGSFVVDTEQLIADALRAMSERPLTNERRRLPVSQNSSKAFVLELAKRTDFQPSAMGKTAVIDGMTRDVVDRAGNLIPENAHPALDGRVGVLQGRVTRDGRPASVVTGFAVLRRAMPFRGDEGIDGQGRRGGITTDGSHADPWVPVLELYELDAANPERAQRIKIVHNTVRGIPPRMSISSGKLVESPHQPGLLILKDATPEESSHLTVGEFDNIRNHVLAHVDWLDRPAGTFGAAS